MNATIGGSFYYRPGDLSKIKLDFHHIDEYRRGGNRFDRPHHQADIAEELDHKITGGGLTFEAYSRDHQHRYAVYSSMQTTLRDSYYGLGGNPDNDLLYGGLSQEEREALAGEAADYYGNTNDLIWVNGLQYAGSPGNHTLTTGIEHRYNQVKDRMPGYGRNINQVTNNIGVYGQYEMLFYDRLRLLLGLRYDHAYVNGAYKLLDDLQETSTTFNALSPRVSVLYDIRNNIQFRAGYARGFRAPQAFDEDLHINAVGGEIQFVTFADDLIQENSDAYTTSIDISGNAGSGQYGILVEGFHTVLRNSFINVGLIEGDNLNTPSIFEKRNAEEDALVTGMNLELKYAPSSSYIFQAGGTLQQSVFSSPITYYTAGESEGMTIMDDRILRAPNLYGFLLSTIKPLEHLELNISGNYTGSMPVPYESGLQRPIGIYDTPDFLTFNVKAAYDFHITKEFTLMIFGGVNNLFNRYQVDFDTGVLRDAGYIYGPVRPRVYFAGIRIGNAL